MIDNDTISRTALEARIRQCKKEADNVVEKIKKEHGFGPQWVGATKIRNILKKHFLKTNNNFGGTGYGQKRT